MEIAAVIGTSSRARRYRERTLARPGDVGTCTDPCRIYFGWAVICSALVTTGCSERARSASGMR
jgi:hypothetical protein